MHKPSYRVIAASVGLLAVMACAGVGCSASRSGMSANVRDCCPTGAPLAPASPAGWVAARSSLVSPLGDAPFERDLDRVDIHPAHTRQTCAACAASPAQIVLRH